MSQHDALNYLDGAHTAAARHPFDPRRDPIEQLLAASSVHATLDAAQAADITTVAPTPHGAGPSVSLAQPRRFVVQADDIRQTCIELSRIGRESTGLRLANAHIAGQLDLRAMKVPQSLKFLGCHFEQAPRLEGAHLHELVLAGASEARPGGGAVLASVLPGLRASGLQLDRDLVLSGSVIHGGQSSANSLTRTAAIWLTEANIGGRVLAVNTTIDTDADRGLQADRTSVTGDVRFIRGFTTNAELRLIGMQIGGSLDLTGATLMPRNGYALNASQAHVGGSVFLVDDPVMALRLQVLGWLVLSRMVIQGRVLIRNADLVSPPPRRRNPSDNSARQMNHPVIVGQGVEVRGALLVSGDTQVHGGISLPGARLLAGATLDGIRVRNHGDVAVELSQAELGGGLSIRQAELEGSLDLRNTTIGGPLDLRELSVSAPRTGRAILGVGAQVAGDVRLTKAHVHGGSVHFRSARINGLLDLDGTSIINPGDRTLGLHQARIGGNVRLCHGFTSIGVVILDHVDIVGRLRCDGGHFAWTGGPEHPDLAQESNRRGAAVRAISMTVRSGMALDWHVYQGIVDFSDAATSYLADRPAADWPANSHLDGFTYKGFGALSGSKPAQWDAAVRSRWLRDIGCEDPGPWEQAARVLRENGDVNGAEDILVSYRRSLRQRRVGGQQRWWRRVVDLAADLAVAYGYRPQRALGFMAVLILAVLASLTVGGGSALMRTANDAGLVFTPTGLAPGASQPGGFDLPSIDGDCGHGHVRCFNPTLYAIDTVVPIIDLNQRSTWYPSSDDGGGWLEWWLNLCTILGWFTSTVFALSLARFGGTRSTP